MDKPTEYSNPTKNIEAIPGPSIEGVEKSSIPSKNINTSVSTKRARKEKNKIGNEKIETVEARGKKTEKNSLPVKRPAMFPLTTLEANDMVMNSIMNIGKRDGASFEDISQYMEENYNVNMELLDAYVENFLENGVENGILERVNGTAGEERFKIKVAEGVKKTRQNSTLREGMDAQTKKPKRASTPDNKNLRGKSAARSPKPEVSIPEIHSRDQATESTHMNESSEAISVSSKVTEAPSERPKTVFKKRTKSAEKSDTESKKRKTSAKTKNMKIVSVDESKSLKRKASDLKTYEMVMEAIKSLKKRNGVSLKEIMRHMEKNHTKVLRSNVSKFLNKGVEEGALEKLGRAGGEERYKIKKRGTVKKDSRNLRQKMVKVKSVRKKAPPKKAAKRRRV